MFDCSGLTIRALALRHPMLMSLWHHLISLNEGRWRGTKILASQNSPRTTGEAINARKFETHFHSLISLHQHWNLLNFGFGFVEEITCATVLKLNDLNTIHQHWNLLNFGFVEEITCATVLKLNDMNFKKAKSRKNLQHCTPSGLGGKGWGRPTKG